MSSRSAAAQAAYWLKFGAGVYLFRDFVCEPTVCVGPSMMPTFNPRGDVVLLESLSRRTGRIERGDVVVAASPTNPRHAVCKRVRGLPGDTVTVGTPIPGYVPSPRAIALADDTLIVPPGHVWLQGDNAANSTDSRAYGAVPLALVRGRVFAKVWPPWEAGWVGREVPRDWAEQRYDVKKRR